jgi:hypothetical protein
MISIGAEHFDFLERHHGSHKSIVGFRLAAGSNESEDRGILPRHDFHAERAGNADARLLNETVRHNRQKLAGFRAEELHQTDKLPFPRERQFFQSGRAVNLLLLDDIGRDAQGKHAIFTDAAVD